jgi:hypothetical protein
MDIFFCGLPVIFRLVDVEVTKVETIIAPVLSSSSKGLSNSFQNLRRSVDDVPQIISASASEVNSY